MSFPNLFVSSLKVIRPKEYGIIALTLMSVALVSVSKASLADTSPLNESVFSGSTKGKSFSLISSVSSFLETLSQDGTTGFGVVMRRQKHSKVFSSCLRPCCEAPCNLTAVFSLDEVSKENTADLGGEGA